MPGVRCTATTVAAFLSTWFLLLCIVNPTHSSTAPTSTTTATAASSTSNQDEGDGSSTRHRRDGYGYGGYGGGGYGMGSYGCTCPYSSCTDNKSDGLMAFGVGALLGLLLALLRNGMMMMAGGGGGRRQGSSGAMEDSNIDLSLNAQHMMNDAMPEANYSWAGSSANARATTIEHHESSSLAEMFHLPSTFGDDLAPVLADLMKIFTDGDKRPECMRRWICEATRQSMEAGGLRARFGSLSSIALGWYTKDLTPFLHNFFPGSKEIDCKYLSPKCDIPFTVG